MPASGSLEFRGISADLLAATDSGDIRVIGGAAVELSSAAGRVDVEGASGVTARAGSGEVRCRDITGPVVAEIREVAASARQRTGVEISEDELRAAIERADLALVLVDARDAPIGQPAMQAIFSRGHLRQSESARGVGESEIWMLADKEISLVPVLAGPAGELDQPAACQFPAQRAVGIGERQRKETRAADGQYLRRRLARDHLDLIAAAHEADLTIRVALHDVDLVVVDFDPHWGVVPRAGA